jgi:hypothetical protein
MLAPLCVGQYLSDGKRLVEIRWIGKEYVGVLDVLQPLFEPRTESIPLREVGHGWFRVLPRRGSIAA